MSSSQPARGHHGPPWVMIGTVLLMLLFDFVLYFLHSRFRLSPQFGTGCIFGQMAFVVMWCGLLGRTWITGWLYAMALILLGGLVQIISVVFVVRMLPAELVDLTMMLPASTLGLCTPLAAMRSLRGWSLTRDNKTTQLKGDYRVEDLFLFSICVASVIAFGQLANLKGAMRGIELGMLLMGFTLSWIFIVPVTAIAFRSKSWWTRSVGLMAITSLYTGLLLILQLLVNGNTIKQTLEFFTQGPPLVFAWLCGIVAMLMSGYRLTSFAPRTAAAAAAAAAEVTKPSSPFDQDEIVAPAAPETHNLAARKQARWSTAGVVAVTIAFLMTSYYRDRLAVARYAALSDPVEYFHARVASFDYRENDIVGVTMSTEANETDLIEVASRAPLLERLSLAGSKFDDETVPVLGIFPHLSELDLSGTRITDRGLSQLRPVRSLLLADTNVSFSAALEYCQSKSVNTLDLSGTQLTDDQIVQVSDAANSDKQRFTTLKLARNPFSDVGVSALFRLCNVSYLLDVGDTQITGNSLPQVGGPTTIILDGTRVNDAVLGRLLALPSWRCAQLSLRRTDISDAMLPRLFGRGVALGGGKITEADLLKWPALKFSELKLSGPDFNGESLASGKIKVDRLDLSRSAVTDEILKKLHPLGWIDYLKLSHTKVSIQGVIGFNASEIDLRHSPISGTDVANNFDHILSHRILIRHEKCSPEELLNLQEKRVIIDEHSKGPEW